MYQPFSAQTLASSGSPEKQWNTVLLGGADALQRLDDVVVGVAVVDLQGEAVLLGDLDVGFERLELGSARACSSRPSSARAGTSRDRSRRRLARAGARPARRSRRWPRSSRPRRRGAAPRSGAAPPRRAREARAPRSRPTSATWAGRCRPAPRRGCRRSTRGRGARGSRAPRRRGSRGGCGCRRPATVSAWGSGG